MSVRREVETVRTRAGVWRRGDHTVLRVTGADAGAWLQSQTTNDVLSHSSGEGCVNALLDRKGRVQAAFTAHRWDDEYWLILEKPFVQPFLDRVESHVFLEDVQVADVGGEAVQLMVEGPDALLLLAQLGAPTPEEVARAYPTQAYAFGPVQVLDRDILAFRMSESGLDGFLLLADAEIADAFQRDLMAALEGFGAMPVGEAARDCLLVEGAALRADRELTGREIINETPLAHSAVDYGKGCYLGQEVVARLRAYGSPKRALTALVMADGDGAFPETGELLRIGGTRVGAMASSTFSPTLDAWLGLAYLDRDHRTPGMTHDFDGFRAEVRHLPVFEPKDRTALARERYETALEVFEADTEDIDETAIELLKEAIVLAPDFEDAFESLGVILNRHQRVDEAIHYMGMLAALNPNSVMAHSNLSVFYMTQGRIQEAEDEKARAAQLEHMAELDTRRAAADAAEQRAKLRREAEDRIGMFHEVLEIDPEDPVATMGLGTAHMQLEDYESAVPFLQTAVRANPDYSAAYLNLGKCLEFLKRNDEAARVYRDGIAAAGRKGDFMPLREMERRVDALKRVET